MAALGLFLGLLLGCAWSVAAQADVSHREASFNGTAYVHLLLTQPLSLRNSHIGLGFKSCIGGPLFRQEARPGVPGLSLEVRHDGLLLTQTSEGGAKKDTILHSTRLLDNKWHTVELVDRLGNITLSSPGQGEVLVSGEPEAADPTKGSTLIIGGDGYKGCLLEGPSVVLSGRALSYGAIWGACDTDCDGCGGCGPHGTCGEDGICVCQSRFSGAHCEKDQGSPCFANGQHPCQGDAACLDLPNGEYKCLCGAGRHGRHCELQACEHPCLNGGTCVNDPSGQHRCLCVEGFSGADCETRVEVCAAGTCLNGGECEERPGGGFKCRCDRTGYEGDRCEKNSDECLNKPCLNDGTCFDTYGGYVCQCRSGFDGQNCEQNLDECSSNPCPSGTTCKDLIGGFECMCPPGSTECATTCATAPCQNGGTCHEAVGGFNCSCTPAFMGETCQFAACEMRPCLNQGVCKTDGCHCNETQTGPFCEEFVTCSYGPCQNGATCHDTPNGFECACALGFEGSTCRHNVDDCISSPCLNDAKCEDGISTYLCHCVPGFSGSHCENRVDACATAPCRNAGTCSADSSGGFSCSCSDGFGGERCERQVDACESSPCQNGGSCNATPSGGYYCECPLGLEGLHCESNVDDCKGKNCPEGHECVDLVNGHECRCPEGFFGPNCSDDMDHCVNHKCANNAVCRDGVANYTCVCPPGFEGPLCEDNVDECKLEPNRCNHGICIDNIGSYNCFCRPGFSGIHCDLDFDECLSHPCKNGASCTNMVNGYNCTCLPGYTGKDCETNIDDCASSPCLNGGTCIDGVASFNCSCLDGIKGDLCEINIDDCEFEPCQNGGLCVDGINRYDCDCAGTGYEGLHCELNIDDCISDVCHNGATCVDQVNGFNCSCHNGYTGKQCELDIRECDSTPCRYNGTCLELSDQSLYEDLSAPWRHLLPERFSYERAEGFRCDCPAGTSGETCEVNIDECASSPCQRGTCQDLLNAYECKCEKGFTGDHCETDINECEPQPCVHGNCSDLQAEYLCDCFPGYGGRNCSVELRGCQEPVCQNGGTCNPWLYEESEHRFNCACPKGFHGKTCSRETTLSFAGNTSKVSVTTTRDEGYDIQFRFRTTLKSGQLVEGKGNPSLFFLELVSGRLNLNTPLLNRIEGVFIGSELNDGGWKHVFLSINASHVVLSALNEQSIYQIVSEFSENPSTTVFPTTRLGGSSNNPLRKANFVGSFVGCMEDVVVNGKWVLPKDGQLGAPDEDQGDVAKTEMTGVEAGCQRTEQCEPNPCQSGGVCTDLWRTFHCACQRPHLGRTCQFEMIAATFGHENSSEGFVTVQAFDEAKRIIRQVMSISMFVRTRKPDGVLFHLGAVDSDTVIWAQLYRGELSVHVNLNTTESYPVGGTRLDDGHRHLIEVVRNVTLVEVRINGSEYFRKTISFGSNLNAPVLYLGGKPAPEVSATEAVRAVRQTAASPAPLEAAPSHPPPFKGILQDVQLSNGSVTLAVQFYPLQEAQVFPSFGDVIFEPGAVLEGVVSDDACRDNPCLHEGVCEVTWNDFACVCTPGYKGKTCDEMEFCQLHKCPDLSSCQNLDAGFECLAHATFNAGPTDPPLHYEAPIRPDNWWGPPEVSVDFRTATGGELLTSTHGTDMLHLYVTANGSSAVIEANVSNFTWKASLGLPEGGNWTRLTVRLDSEGHPVAIVDSEDPEIAPTAVDSTAWMRLLRGGTLSVSGGLRGCLGAVRVSGVLAPFFTSTEVNASTKSRHWLASVSSVQPPKGCVLCFEAECQNNGTCRDPSDAYECSCPAGFRGQKCEENIDECENNNCLNGATCIDHIDNYSCQCVPGFTGVSCESDINECESSPCLNNGNCTDELNAFKCACPEDFVGDRCESMRRVSCENNPCFNKAHCEDIPHTYSGDNFTCNCRDGFEGIHCKEAFCQVESCANGAFCDPETPACICPKGYEGRFCKQDIDECKPKPCLHHGRCIDNIGNFECDCSGTGFIGRTCQEDINECLVQPDRCGQGTCINSIGSFQCKCNNDLFCGPACDIPNPCQPNSCENGGTCQPVCTVEQNFTCNCPEGYTGQFCEQELEEESGGVSGLDLALIITPIVCLLALIAGAGLAVFVSLARKKRATRGTYSPSQQEYCNPRLELDHVLKPPPEERLI